MMMNGRNNGKKLLAVRIVAHAFEIINLLSDQNPIQVSLKRNPNVLKEINNLVRFLLTLSSTLVPVKTLPVLVPRVLSAVKLSMSRLCDESTSPSPSLPLVYVVFKRRDLLAFTHVFVDP